MEAISAIVWALLSCSLCSLYNYCRCSCAEQITIHSFIHSFIHPFMIDILIRWRHVITIKHMPGVRVIGKPLASVRLLRSAAHTAG